MAAKTGTYTLINSTTLTTATASVSFSSIPGTYTDLVLVSEMLSTQGGTQGLYLRFNSDTGTNYSDTELQGNGTSASSGRDTNDTGIRSVFVDNTNRSISTVNIMDYSNTTTFKTAVLRANSAGIYARAAVGLWRSTAAITSVSLVMPVNNFASGSTFKLYGIEAGNL